MYPPEILAQLLRISTHDAFELLGKPDRRTAADAKLRTGTLKIPQGVGPLLPAHRAYLRGRGLDPDVMASVWGIQGIGNEKRLKWRLWIPIADRFGKVVSWTTRAIGKENPIRYWSATLEEEEVSHKSIIFGAHLARHVLIVCEGPISAVSIGPGAGATCGVGFSAAQKAAIAEYPVRAICFDNEPDAQRRAQELCNDLSGMPGVTDNIELETGNDPNSCDPAEVAEIRKKYFPEYLDFAA